jgi:hypothetical protein
MFIFAVCKHKLDIIMSHIYYEKKEIPIPEGGHVNRNDGAVRIYLDPSVPRRKSPTMVIGKATGATTMHPNDNFRQRYPSLWEQYYEEKAPVHVLHYGMYLSALSIGCRTGLYGALQAAFGPLYANALMDWAMFTVLSRTNVASSFPGVMADQVVFSGRRHGDAWFSDLFRERISPEAVERFKDAWLEKVKAFDAGVEESWVAIDGSNADCSVSGSCLAAAGKAKSRGDGPVVGYMYAVDSRNGLPLTFEVFEGNVPDTKALQRMRNRLHRSGLRVRGALLDRIFCERPSIGAVESLGWDWVVMLRKDNAAHQAMMARAREVRWNLAHLVDGRGVFGVRGSAPLFKGSGEESCVCLFYDGANGTDRCLRLIEKVLGAEQDILRQAARGELPPSVPQGMDRYLSVRESGGRWEVGRNLAAWQADLDAKGYYSIASSTEMEAAEMHSTYYLRDTCEKAYSVMGSLLGSDVTRVHSDRAILARHLATFVAQVIRSVFARECRALRLDAGRMLKEMDRLHISLFDSDRYACVHDESTRQRSLLRALGFAAEDMEAVVSDINRRNRDAVVSQVHKMPVTVDPKAERPRGRKAKKQRDIAEGRRPAEEEPRPKGKPGRPKGSKNKNKKEKEKTEAAKPEKKRGPGRPKGSTKDKKGGKGKAKADEPKRSPGRPKGSKNKKTLQREAEMEKRKKRMSGNG